MKHSSEAADLVLLCSFLSSSSLLLPQHRNRLHNCGYTFPAVANSLWRHVGLAPKTIMLEKCALVSEMMMSWWAKYHLIVQKTWMVQWILFLDAGSENPWSDKLDILPITMSILAQKDFSDFFTIFAVDKRETVLLAFKYCVNACLLLICKSTLCWFLPMES